MGQRVSETGVLTTINLTIIAIAAVLTIIAILYGAAQKRKRAAAERIERERIEEEGGHIATPSEAAAPLAEPEVTPPAPPVAQTPEPAAPEQTAPEPAPSTPAAPEQTAPDPEPTPLADEPIAAAAPQDASPATQAAPAAQGPAPEPAPPAAPAQSYADAPVTILKGLGPKVATRLAELGVTTVGQLAALDTRAAQDLDAHLGPFTGRMTRDRWLDQAKLLAAGDKAGFEAAFGRL